jgi:hypothetical protein
MPQGIGNTGQPFVRWAFLEYLVQDVKCCFIIAKIPRAFPYKSACVAGVEGNFVLCCTPVSSTIACSNCKIQVIA